MIYIGLGNSIHLLNDAGVYAVYIFFKFMLLHIKRYRLIHKTQYTGAGCPVGRQKNVGF